MASQWYYQVMGEVLGPVSASGLKHLAREGDVSSDTLVRKGTEGNWVHAERLKGLFDGAARGGNAGQGGEQPSHARADVISVRCSCGKSLKVNAKYAGKHAKCRNCGHELLIPEGMHAADIARKASPTFAPLSSDLLQELDNPVIPRKVSPMVAPVKDVSPVRPWGAATEAASAGLHASMPGWLKAAYTCVLVTRKIAFFFFWFFAVGAVVVLSIGAAEGLFAIFGGDVKGLVMVVEGLVMAVFPGVTAALIWLLYLLSRRALTDLENGETGRAFAVGILNLPSIMGILILVGIHTKASRMWCQRQRAA